MIGQAALAAAWTVRSPTVLRVRLALGQCDWALSVALAALLGKEHHIGSGDWSLGQS